MNKLRPESCLFSWYFLFSPACPTSSNENNFEGKENEQRRTGKFVAYLLWGLHSHFEYLFVWVAGTHSPDPSYLNKTSKDNTISYPIQLMLSLALTWHHYSFILYGWSSFEIDANKSNTIIYLPLQNYLLKIWNCILTTRIYLYLALALHVYMLIVINI